MSHSAEKFRGHSFNVSENLGYQKILCIIGGITIFPRKFFVSVPKNFVKEPFSVSLILDVKKFYAYEGNITIFYRKFVVSQYRKTS